jgi:hypothetical protein
VRAGAVALRTLTGGIVPVIGHCGFCRVLPALAQVLPRELSSKLPVDGAALVAADARTLPKHLGRRRLWRCCPPAPEPYLWPHLILMRQRLISSIGLKPFATTGEQGANGDR